MTTTVVQHADVATIERELRELWKELATDKEAQSGPPVLRACVLNLIVYAPGTAESVGSVLAEVAMRNPSRMLVLETRPDGDGTEAFVTALCHRTPSKRQVCCELIRLEGHGTGARHLPSLVRPLLVPDLPTALWWRQPTFPEGRLFDELLRVADRLVLDSRSFGPAESTLRQLNGLIQRETSSTKLSDLAWASLTLWRTMLAGFYDVPHLREALDTVRHVEILGGEGQPGIETWLLAGWLGSRLKWKPLEAKAQENGHSLRFESRNGPVKVVLRPGVEARGLDRIVLQGNGQRFVVEKTEDGEYLKASARDSPTGCGKMARLQLEDEAAGLSAELEMLAGDAIYESALRFLQGLIERAPA